MTACDICADDPEPCVHCWQARAERTLRIAALALERVQVGDALEAEMLLEQVVTLNAQYVEPKP